MPNSPHTYSLAFTGQSVIKEDVLAYATDATGRIPARPGSNRLRVNTTIAMRENELAMLHALSVDAGAGAVVSHGVPMLQGIEIYKGAPLLFGLGNFIFHTYQPAKYTDERIWQSVVAKAIYSGRSLERLELYPVVAGGERALADEDYTARRVPHLARGAYGESILRRLAEMSQAFGTQIEIAEGKGVIHAAQS